MRVEDRNESSPFPVGKQRNKPVIIALVLVLTISTGLWAGPVAAEADLYEQQGNDRSAGAMVVDALAVRPLGMAATLLGSAVFIISLPFSALGGNVDEGEQGREQCGEEGFHGQILSCVEESIGLRLACRATHCSAAM